LDWKAETGGCTGEVESRVRAQLMVFGATWGMTKAPQMQREPGGSREGMG
jgi:hypothetical protein